jgi:hypothetical protein
MQAESSPLVVTILVHDLLGIIVFVAGHDWRYSVSSRHNLRSMSD